MTFLIKISKPGFDVLTAQNRDLSFSSELATHSIYQILSVNKPSGSAGITINHNLGFVPKVWVYKDEGAYYRRLPIEEWGYEQDYYITSSIIYIKGNPSSASINYKVIIFTRSV